ncbi:anti-sigma factor [Mesorhizobium sp. LHD-90]|uniref:anti-sigma factor family protein n=1 Tax=Mesorhizobium sp. LHD-90 TaxID=3071414 RepID=UPI0027DF3040|nr:anti-sigma factor [Mesorhizobium sp. LHD-90]MDQ6437858.1 anti-sigma factor [Mesorhizobium sp. LHD-90]
MTKADFTDETLMRYADGELDAATAEALERDMETDDDLVARVALFIETRAAAKEALRPLLDEPVPAELTASVERMIAGKRAAGVAPQSGAGKPEAVVIPIAAAREVRRPKPVWLLPVAASLVAALVGGFLGFRLEQGGDIPPRGDIIAGIDSPALRQALASVPSGQEQQVDEHRFRAIATFTDRRQETCREFELDSETRSTVIAVACAAEGGWRVDFAVAAPGDSSGYAPASSTEALDAYLGAIEAAAPMAAAEEAAALKAIREPSKQ